ncbi:MAG TPA: MotA/TolQ/ExbB proton channel family protein [Alphaproteobacteria bacterium]|nr:MotA/TolQ/ExbB proton channel family protein [Alphaproteobacteria bacterium]
MEEFESIGRLITEADLIIKAVLVILLFQSVYIWHAVIQFIFRSRRVKGDRQLMIEALANADIDGIRRVLASYAHFRPATAPTVGSSDEAEKDGLFDDVWSEIYDLLTTKNSGLATISATAPFVGLFGTVWGILVAFSSIRSAETITFSALAPAIGEALFATLAGLFVAIPAVIANNWIASQAFKLSRQCTHAYVELAGELRRLGRRPGNGGW